MYVFSFGTAQDIFQSVYRVYGWLCVCHTDDRSKSAFCGSEGTGVDIFFVSKSRITEMYMGVNKSRCDSQPGKIQNFFIILWLKILTEFCNDSVFCTNIHNFVCFRCRINEMSVF